jgi:hypothetical protein
MHHAQQLYGREQQGKRFKLLTVCAPVPDHRVGGPPPHVGD